MLIKPTRPRTDVDPDAIPASMKAERRWGLWRPVWRVRRWEKVPLLSTNKPDVWMTFDEAMAEREGQEDKFGLGFVLTGIEDFTAFDLDHVLDQDGRPEPWAARMITALDSYTEVTVGRDGLRIFVRGAYKSDWINKDDVSLEVYSGHGGRFVTVTGDLWLGTPEEIMRPADDVLTGIESQYRQSAHAEQVVVGEMPELLEDVEVPEGLNAEARRFLDSGECDEDRSSALQWSARCLFEVGLDEQQVLSVLAENDHCMATALDHRRQDEGRALVYLWKHHVCKAKPKANVVATANDFADLVEIDPERERLQAEIRMLASLPDEVFAARAKDEAKRLGMAVADLKRFVARTKRGARRVAKGLPDFNRAEDGMIRCNADNTTLAVACPLITGMVIGYDTFRDEVMFYPASDVLAQWQTFLDQQYNWIRKAMDRAGFERTSLELVRAAVDDVARLNAFDSAQLWLESLPAWDGVKRVTKFHHRYLGSEDGEWADAVSEYLWTALVGRVMSPGCQADMVPVWISEEGMRKSTIVAEMAPSRDFVTMMSFHEKETDLARKMRGRLIAEIAELAGMARKEVEAAKAWITKRFEDWTPKFKEFNTQFPRRFVPIGTTNRSDFLVSETGNRRFLPINVGAGRPAAVSEDRDQLWAEALEMWKEAGDVKWEAAHTIGKSVVGKHMAHEPWTDVILDWLHRADVYTDVCPVTLGFLPTTMILKDALGIDPGRTTSVDTRRVATAMRALGYTTVKRRVSYAPNPVNGWECS